MSKINKDEEREHRIHNEIVVDAYHEDEVKMSWYYYLQDHLNFPFHATHKIKQKGGGQRQQKVEVVEMEPDEDFGEDILVGIAYDQDIFYVPLLSLENITADEESMQAIEDWQYWNEQGYQW